MRIIIVTLFPEIFTPILNSSILKRAQDKGLVEFELINLRRFGEGIHKSVDDRPYGGGAGMILKPDVLARAILKIQDQKAKIILTSASGKPFFQKKARELSKFNHIILVCGHYEGVDQRFIDKYVDEEISIGDYILTGGEIPAMVIVDAVTRLVPGVLEKEGVTEQESFSDIRYPISDIRLLEYPHYTRPEQFEGKKVPEILLSGNHAQIKKWRLEQALQKTQKLRPDLLK